MHASPQTHRITLGDDTFPFTDAGEGAPVLFLHGAATDLRIWQPHGAALGASRRCVAYTQRYHGTQAWRAGGPPYGVKTHAADLNAFIDGVGLPPVTIVAWSYAGHVALHAAGRRPDQFARVVVFEAALRPLALEDDEAQAVARDAEAMFGPIFAAAARGDLVEATRAMIDASGGPGYFDALTPTRRALYLENAHTLPLLLAQEEPPEVTSRMLAGLPMPVHVLWGGASRAIGKVPSKALARCWPAGLHREIPGANHLWPEEAPEALVATVLDLERS